MKIGIRARADQRGFTLAELMVAIAILVLIMGGVFTLLMTGNQSYLTGSNQAEAQAAVRAALERMTTDIREGGYDPQGRACTAVGVPAGCFAAVVNPGNVALIPTAASFMVQSDWNGAGPAAPASPIEPLVQACISYSWAAVPSPLPCPAAPATIPRGEQITYTVAGGALCRQESAVDPAATAPCAAGQPLVTGVQQAATGSNCAGALIPNPPFFQYCTAAGGVPATPDQIMTVIVNLRVGVQNQPPAIWQAGMVTVTMSDRIRLRNRI